MFIFGFLFGPRARDLGFNRTRVFVAAAGMAQSVEIQDTRPVSRLGGGILALPAPGKEKGTVR